MSIAGDRQEIADILTELDDIKGYRYRPTAMRTGDAWPLLEVLERGLGHDFDVTWRVAVVLPSGERAASEWFDEHHELLAEAFEDFGLVERIEPGRLDTEAGDKDILIMTVRKEA